MQWAEGTDPTAKEPAEYYGQYNSDKGPKKGPVELVSGQNGSDCHQWVELQEPVNGPGADLPEFFSYGGDYAEPNE